MTINWLTIKQSYEMQRQGGVHNPVIPREKAVAESFHERIVEVALEQWTQPHIQSDAP